MRTIDFDTIKKIWKHKLTRNFDAEKELFNIYIDSPFCFSPRCKFCIYKPHMLKNEGDISLKDRYYDEVLIDNIDSFGAILELRQPDAVYFGGGTSSLMTIPQMNKIFN
ncbi:hypothetical protein ACFL96_18140, partial [Thermoproteota archaeon]